jgi:hypothetical protein
MKFLRTAALLAAMSLYALSANASDEVSIRGRKTYLLKVVSGQHGKVSPSKRSTALAGATKNYVVTPDRGYLIDTLTVNGAPLKGLPKKLGKAFSFTLKNIRDNLTVIAKFATSRTRRPLSVGNQVSVVDAKK